MHKVGSDTRLAEFHQEQEAGQVSVVTSDAIETRLHPLHKVGSDTRLSQFHKEKEVNNPPPTGSGPESKS